MLTKRCICVLGLALICQFAKSESIRDIRGDPVNGFPIISRVEAFAGESVRTNGLFKFYLPVGDQRYLPISEELATKLSVAPSIQCRSGLHVRVLSCRCTPRVLNIPSNGTFSSLEGAIMEWAIEIQPESTVPPDEYQIILAFNSLNLASREWREDPAPQVRLEVRVWGSHAEKAQFEGPATERQEGEARSLPQKVGQQRTSSFLKWMLATRTLLTAAGATLLIAALIGGFLFRFRNWLRPAAKVAIMPGQHLQIRQAVAANAGEEYEEPGTVLETLWARNRRGQRQRIKVELFIATDGEDAPPIEKARTIETTHHEFTGGGKPSVAALTNLKLDLLISVGASVLPGHFLAEGPHGAVRVHVLRGAS